MRLKRLMQFLKDYYFQIIYNLVNVNMVVGALSKENHSNICNYVKRVKID